MYSEAYENYLTSEFNRLTPGLQDLIDADRKDAPEFDMTFDEHEDEPQTEGCPEYHEYYEASDYLADLEKDPFAGLP